MSCLPAFDEAVPTAQKVLDDAGWLLQEPKVRPTAKYLMQHKLVAQTRQGLPPPALLPLIQRSQELINESHLVDLPSSEDDDTG